MTWRQPGFQERPSLRLGPSKPRQSNDKGSLDAQQAHACLAQGSKGLRASTGKRLLLQPLWEVGSMRMGGAGEYMSSRWDEAQRAMKGSTLAPPRGSNQASHIWSPCTVPWGSSAHMSLPTAGATT